MINVGIIGCGKIAQVRHLPEYASNGDANVAAVYSPNSERAASIAEQYGAKAYETCEELLADPAIDAVSVCSTNASHCEIAVNALRAGKHVLCEKPMATTLAECKLMVKTARETGKYLMVAQNQRFAKAHIDAQKLIASGEIGEILTFRTSFCHKGPESWTINPGNNWFFDKTRAAFGVMADLGVHKTDLLHFLTGKNTIRVNAVAKTLEKKDRDGKLIGVDDNAICIYELEGGATGTMTVSWTCCGAEENSTVLYGTQGVMRIYDDPESSLIVEQRSGKRVVYQSDKIATNDEQTRSGVIDSWIHSIKTASLPAVPMDESLYVMKVIFAAFESSHTGMSVSV